MSVKTLPQPPALVRPKTRKITAQPGPQHEFLSTPADIAIGGGEAGGGKTFALLLEPLRHIQVSDFNAVVFRRNEKDVRNPGGLWDESRKIYNPAGLVPLQQPLEWSPPTIAAKIKMSHLQYEDTVYAWDGAQICLLEFDQLEHFTEEQFFYLLARNRSTCGVQPYCRATCNPDPDSWLAKFLEWWIDQEPVLEGGHTANPNYGYPLQERSGILRWFVRLQEEISWFDSREEAYDAALEAGFTEVEASAMPKSVTFIPSSVHDNPALLEKDPGYIGKLLALPHYQRLRLYGGQGRRGGNWKVRASAGTFFNRDWFGIVDSVPPGTRKRVRYWDKAGTEDGGKFTAGVRMCVVGTGAQQRFYIEDVVRGQWSAMKREDMIATTAGADDDVGRKGIPTTQWVEQEPGSGGKESAENTVRSLAGHRIRVDKVTGDKFVRAEPLQNQAERGNVKLVRARWNEAFLRELHNADPQADYNEQLLDQMDAASGAFNKVTAPGGEPYRPGAFEPVRYT